MLKMPPDMDSSHYSFYDIETTAKPNYNNHDGPAGGPGYRRSELR